MALKITPRELGNLLHQCANAMDADDKQRIDAGEMVMRGSASGPSGRGRVICETVAVAQDVGPWGEIAYYLLAYAWNDVLSWANRQIVD